MNYYYYHYIHPFPSTLHKVHLCTRHCIIYQQNIPTVLFGAGFEECIYNAVSGLFSGISHVMVILFLSRGADLSNKVSCVITSDLGPTNCLSAREIQKM